MSNKDLKRDVIEAGKIAVRELIKVAKEPIVTNSDEDLSADKLKSAAQAKRIAVEDALAIIQRIEDEETMLKDSELPESVTSSKGFVERRAR